MGGCVGKNAVGIETKEIRLLLLGAPGVGKSTVFKQINKLYVSDFSDQYRQDTRKLIRMAVVITVGAILTISAETDEEFPKDDADVQRVRELASKCDDPDVLAAAAHFESLDDCAAKVTKLPTFLAAVHLLEQGTDPRIKDIEVPDSAIYFLSRLDEIAKPDYIPIDADILRLRRVTEAADPIHFRVPMEWPPYSGQTRSIDVGCTDVGGQAHHEYDWVQHGQDCDAVLFVASLSYYCKVNSEGKNMLVEQMQTLRRVSQADAFKGKQFVILFNKSDVFIEALKRHQVADYFKSFNGANTEEAVFEYFRRKCLKLMSKSDQEREVSMIRTCALDTSLMEQVLTRVLMGLFRNILKDSWNT